MVSEFDEVIKVLVVKGDVKGLVVCSVKFVFIVGVDIIEFIGLFVMEDVEVLNWVVNIL